MSSQQIEISFAETTNNVDLIVNIPNDQIYNDPFTSVDYIQEPPSVEVYHTNV